MDWEKKTILVTGASQGLGLELSKLLASKGSNVYLVARNEDRLASATESCRSLKLESSQIIEYIKADMSNPEAAKMAVDSIPNCPDAVFCLAGGSRPGLIGDITPEIINNQIAINYLTAFFTSQAFMQRIKNESDRKQRLLVLCSSLAAFIGLTGYEAYSPMKAAVKSLSDILRQEAKPWNVDVRCCCPGNIASPGLVSENETKPSILFELEGTDEAISPQKAAQLLLQSIRKGHYLITFDLTGDLLRRLGGGGSPMNNVFADFFLGIIAFFVWPFFRWSHDRKVYNWTISQQDDQKSK